MMDRIVNMAGLGYVTFLKALCFYSKSGVIDRIGGCKERKENLQTKGEPSVHSLHHMCPRTSTIPRTRGNFAMICNTYQSGLPKVQDNGGMNTPVAPKL